MDVWAGDVEKARAQRTHWLVALLAEAAVWSIFFLAAAIPCLCWVLSVVMPQLLSVNCEA
jgi:hypothetical protein